MSRKAKVALKVYKFLETYKEENDGNSPTYETIGENFGFTSQNAWSHVERLARYGMLKVGADRSITLGGEYIPPRRQE